MSGKVKSANGAPSRETDEGSGRSSINARFEQSRRIASFRDLNIVGESPAFLEILHYVSKYAICDVPVLILGETGTGKELVARALHYLSGRKDRPFVPVNCGALPDTLVENELFGHSRGAYTDARAHQKGLVALAEGGTLLLDEVDALSGKAQVSLLRFLQDGCYRPLGAEEPVQANVRLVAATNADLGALIAKGEFRQDLLFRLNVAPLRVPSLRERGQDILLLAGHFLKQYSAQYSAVPPVLGPDIQCALTEYHWPGNIRELENVMHRAVILSSTGEFDSLPLGALSVASESGVTCGSSGRGEFSGGLKCARARCLAQFERRYLLWLLRQTNGNVSAAARTAGTERRHLGRIIKRVGLSPDMFR